MKDRALASRGPEYFEALYAANPDPWNFSKSKYEHEKYQATLKILGKRAFQSGFEIGCSIGILTKMLAARCQSLLAVDIVETALRAARENCSPLKHITFKKLQVPVEWPAEHKFDLIICSEILYYMSPDDISSVASLACKSLLNRGNILLINYTGQITEPCSGDRAAEIFIREAGGCTMLRRQIRKETFRVDLLTSINFSLEREAH